MKASFSSCSTIAAILLHTSLITAFSFPEIQTFGSTPAIGQCEAKFVSSSSGIDSPKFSCINETGFDWWYFDVVSPDLQTSLVIVFYLTTDGGFPLALDTANIVPTIGISALLPNGTVVRYGLNATEAIISSTLSGQGDWFGSGASWNTFTSDNSVYLVEINSPSTGIFGTFELNSIAPPHYPCGPNQAGETMLVGPHIGWSNAVPDAIGTVNLSIKGTKLKFTGVAYHDKNWSDQPFLNSVGSWYWGHGRIGRYSIVWFDFLAPNGTEYVSSYVSHSGKIITATCAADSIKVRPTGSGSLYPPTQASNNPEGFNISFDLENGGSGFVNVTAYSIIASAGGLYMRWIGNMTGEINGEVLTDGVALYESFAVST